MGLRRHREPRGAVAVDLQRERGAAGLLIRRDVEISGSSFIAAAPWGPTPRDRQGLRLETYWNCVRESRCRSADSCAACK